MPLATFVSGGAPTSSRRLAVFAFLLATPAHAAFLNIAAPSASPGETVAFAAVLTTEGDEVASLALDIGFAPVNPVRAAGSFPDCTLDDAIDKPTTAFRYRPVGCTVGVDCSIVRAGVTSFLPDTAKLPIPDGRVFTCRVTVPAETPIGERIDLVVVRASVIDPDDRETDVRVASRGGFIEVVPPPPCPGDCNSDGSVAIDELVRAVAIALGRVAGASCPGLDRDDAPGAGVDDVIAATISSGLGCPSASIPR